MIAENPTLRTLANSRIVGAAVFAGIVISSLYLAFAAIEGVIDRQRSLSVSEELLQQLRGRRSANPVAAGLGRAGSPFLEGPTVTVAGASLLQRVAGAVTAAGASIQSSQIDVDSAQAGDGLVGLVVSFEIEQAALLIALYDIEAGMPFLFIDQLDVQMPAVAAGTEPAKLKIALGVSGQWQRIR